MRRRPPRSTRSVTLLPYPTLFRSYDPDHVLARGEVGKVGVPVAHLGHMGELLDGIPQGEMNTSMTINATAAWMLGLYVANAEKQGTESKALRGTTQNDIVKEYLSRDRKSVVSGKSGSGSVETGGRRIIKNNKKN